MILPIMAFHSLHQFILKLPGKDPRKGYSYNPYQRNLSMHDRCVHVPLMYSKLEFDSDVQIQGPVTYRIRVNRPGKKELKL